MAVAVVALTTYMACQSLLNQIHNPRIQHHLLLISAAHIRISLHAALKGLSVFLLTAIMGTPVLMGLEKYDGAIKACDIAIRIDPNNAAAWSNKAMALEDQGRTTEAIAAYDKANRADAKVKELTLTGWLAWLRSWRPGLSLRFWSLPALAINPTAPSKSMSRSWIHRARRSWP